MNDFQSTAFDSLEIALNIRSRMEANHRSLAEKVREIADGEFAGLGLSEADLEDIPGYREMKTLERNAFLALRQFNKRFERHFPDSDTVH